MPADVKVVKVALVDGTVGVEEVKSEELRMKSEEWAGADNPLTGRLRGAFDLNGQPRSSLQRGMNIVRGADGSVHKIVKR